MSPGRILVAVCVSVALAGAVLLAQGKPAPKPPDPITIDVLGVKRDVTSLQTAGAWPLTIRLVANNALGIGVHRFPDTFPPGPQQGFVVFQDPDNCLWLAATPSGSGCPGVGKVDETYLEFTPTINLPDLAQATVENVPPVQLGEGPALTAWKEPAGLPSPENPGSNTDTYAVGPSVGSYGVNDNYGYGASPNLPGLVILSDTGVGLVWDSYFNLAHPKTARNLGGLVNSVAWTLNDCVGWKVPSDGCDVGRTGVTAHINVPGVTPRAPYKGLFTPVVRVDFNYPDSSFHFADVAYQIDGREWKTGKSLSDLSSELASWVTTVRVFVVSGRGPDELTDLDGDGLVTAKDAKLAGYKLLSDEEVIRFRTYHQEEAYLLGVPFDSSWGLSGMSYPPAPAGGGGMTGIPR
jgi:hypothetical protein